MNSAASSAQNIVIDKTFSPQPAPETEALIEEAARQIKEHLNPDEWRLIKLFHFKKQAHAEIARRLGLPSAGASRKRLCLAVSALRADKGKLTKLSNMLVDTYLSLIFF